jgi:alkaline phosphatase D
MKRQVTFLTAAAAMLGLAACETTGDFGILPGTDSAEAALETYYAGLPKSFYPVAPTGQSLPASDAALSRILVGSCFDEEKEDSPAMRQVAREPADLFLMVGDNVYGDRDGRGYVNNQADLDELRQSFSDLAARPDFKAVRAAHPMMVAWDDHDYGANDAGREFPFRRLAERIHENFWGLGSEDAGARPGTYYARSFGPAGQRTQVIVLDTRFFRSALTPTDDYGKTGKERYIPSADPQQDMLGAAQWSWLEQELRKPADLRLIVSSIQVLPTDGHGWEAWSRLPKEQDKLYDLIGDVGARGVVFVSGDRHASFLYQKPGVLPYTAYELTASSMNVAFAETTEERDSAQLGDGYPPENYGAIDIDWMAGTARLSVKDNAGRTVRQTIAKFR